MILEERLLFVVVDQGNIEAKRLQLLFRSHHWDTEAASGQSDFQIVRGLEQFRQ